jgi:hypothetical protein
MKTDFAVALVLVTFVVGAQAQWVDHPTPGTPRTKDGKADLSAAVPKAADGKPDLSGLWQAEHATIPELRRLMEGGVNGLGEDLPSKYFIDILADFKPGESPALPATAEALRKNRAAMGGSPITKCLPAGVPWVDAFPSPFKIIQTPGMIAILYEADNSFRQIFVDGRKLPEDPVPSWAGYSVGKWDGDSLVVESNGFKDQSWLDAGGHTHSDAMRVTERFRRRDFGHMEVQVTVDDPKAYSKPFTIKITENLLPDTNILEYICLENEHDVPHLK